MKSWILLFLSLPVFASGPFAQKQPTASALYTRDLSLINITQAYGVSTGTIAANITSKSNVCFINGNSTKIYADSSSVADCENTILSASAGGTSSAAATVSTGFTQPALPRVLTITPGGTTADVAACIITVSGYDPAGGAITDTFGFADNATATSVGRKVFQRVSSVAFPANCEDGGFAATWTIKSADRFVIPGSGAACFENTRLDRYLCLRSSSGTLSSSLVEVQVW